MQHRGTDGPRRKLGENIGGGALQNESGGLGVQGQSPGKGFGGTESPRSWSIFVNTVQSNLRLRENYYNNTTVIKNKIIIINLPNLLKASSTEAQWQALPYTANCLKYLDITLCPVPVLDKCVLKQTSLYHISHDSETTNSINTILLRKFSDQAWFYFIISYNGLSATLIKINK